MRINFNNSYRCGRAPIPVWVCDLFTDFLLDHDVDPIRESASRWVYSYEGSKSFAEWLKTKNWKVEWWALPPITDPGTPLYFAYGIAIADDCPVYIEHILKTDANINLAD